MKDYPTTKEEYWQFVEKNREDLQALVAKFHPFYRHQHNMKITAQGAEKACAGIREEIAQKSEDPWTGEKVEQDPQVKFNQYIKDKSPEIVSLFNDVWFGMPESTEVRSEPGFGLLCDLCSESYLLHE